MADSLRERAQVVAQQWLALPNQDARDGAMMIIQHVNPDLYDLAVVELEKLRDDAG